MDNIVDHITMIPHFQVNDSTFRKFRVCGPYLRMYSYTDRYHLYGAYTKRNTLIGAFMLVDADKNKITCVYSLEVRSEYRKKGVASSLLEFAKKEAHSFGAEKLLIQPMDNKPSLVKLYTERGFKTASLSSIKKFRNYLNEREMTLSKKC